MKKVECCFFGGVSAWQLSGDKTCWSLRPQQSTSLCQCGIHHVMTVSCSSFLCALIPHLLTGNHRPSGLVHIAPSPAFPLPLKGPSPFYSSVFQGRRVWRIHPLMMKIQTVDTDLLIISHICTQDDECWMEVAFTCLFIEEVYGKCSRKWKIKRMAGTKLGRFYESF